MKIPRRTRIAQKIYWVSGKLSKIKTPRRTYRVVSIDPEAKNPDDIMVTEPAEVRWMSCHTSMRLLELSAKIDPHHWDHWALVHDRCGPTPCAQCHGCNCGWWEDDDAFEM